MSELPKEVREKTDVLDAVGNTTAATGKGFAIASAALTALALFAAFVGVAGITGIDIYKANVLACLFVGAMIPFIFSALAIRDNIAPPTLNLDNPSDNCAGVDLVPHVPKQRKVKAVLNNSFGFGGTNASLVMRSI